MKQKFIEEIALLNNLTTNDYRILLLLYKNEYTQAELSGKLNVTISSINRRIKYLERLNLIKTTKIIGRTKFQTVNLDWKK